MGKVCNLIAFFSRLQTFPYLPVVRGVAPGDEDSNRRPLRAARRTMKPTYYWMNKHMTEEESTKTMTEVLDETVEKTEGETVTLGEVLDTVGKRSYGPLFLIISIIALIPIVGGIPGMSIFTATIILVLAIQLLFLRAHPWLPKKLLSISFSRDKLVRGVEKARPWTERIGKVVGRRWAIFTQPPFINIVALICIFLGLSFYPLELIPFGVTLPALAVFVFGLALTTHDGLLIVIGLFITALSVWFMTWIWPSSWWPF